MNVGIAPLPKTLRAMSPAVLVASCLHLGRVRPAPGSWASVATALACAPLVLMGANLWLIVVAAGAAVAGWFASAHWLKHSTEKNGEKDNDPSTIVIDEVMGQALVLAVAPPSWAGLALAVILFRLFDISKLWPVSLAERLPGAWGIMSDDALAAAWGGLCLFGLHWQGWVG